MSGLQLRLRPRSRQSSVIGLRFHMDAQDGQRAVRPAVVRYLHVLEHSSLSAWAFSASQAGKLLLGPHSHSPLPSIPVS
jgi:hypothetical protein